MHEFRLSCLVRRPAGRPYGRQVYLLLSLLLRKGFKKKKENWTCETYDSERMKSQVLLIHLLLVRVCSLCWQRLSSPMHLLLSCCCPQPTQAKRGPAGHHHYKDLIPLLSLYRQINLRVACNEKGIDGHFCLLHFY